MDEPRPMQIVVSLSPDRKSLNLATTPDLTNENHVEFIRLMKAAEDVLLRHEPQPRPLVEQASALPHLLRGRPRE